MERALSVLFTVTTLDVESVVERMDRTDADAIVAVSRRGRTKQILPILDPPLSRRRPEGAEWIDVYRRLAAGGAPHEGIAGRAAHGSRLPSPRRVRASGVIPRRLPRRRRRRSRRRRSLYFGFTFIPTGVSTTNPTLRALA